jgi:hypothetical protein
MTSKVSKEKFEMPVILYEDTENGAFSFPYIEVLEGKEMPKVLFMFEYKHTGETEPNDKGKEVPVIDQIPHKFVDKGGMYSIENQRKSQFFLKKHIRTNFKEMDYDFVRADYDEKKFYNETFVCALWQLRVEIKKSTEFKFNKRLQAFV